MILLYKILLPLGYIEFLHVVSTNIFALQEEVHALELAAKGTYYMNCETGQASISAIGFKGGEQKTKVRAVCGYL